MALAQLGQHRQAIEAWQQNIHQHHVEGFLTGHRQALLPVLAPGDLETAAAQLLVHIGTEHQVVFDGKDSGMANSAGSHDYLQIILS
ncbi:hypothetical protein D3C73_1305590 [compost metagenome]